MKILIINGANLNFLGKRENNIYAREQYRRTSVISEGCIEVIS